MWFHPTGWQKPVVDKALAVYTNSGLKLKYECPKVFAGHVLYWNWTKQRIDVKQHIVQCTAKIQNIWSYNPHGRLVSIMAGLIIVACDRQLRGDIRLTLGDLFSCYSVTGYGPLHYQRAMEQVLRRHPYPKTNWRMVFAFGRAKSMTTLLQTIEVRGWYLPFPHCWLQPFWPLHGDLDS